MSGAGGMGAIQRLGLGIAAGAALLLLGASPALAQYATNYVWDGQRRLVMSIQPDPDGVGPLPRTAERRTYDIDGQLTKVEQGYATTANGSDFVAVQASAAFTYDALGQKVKEVVSDTTQTYRVTQFSYDAAGRQTCTAVRMNPAVYATLSANACALGTAGSNGPDRITQTLYDAASQVTKTVRGLGTPLAQDYATYTWTANGKQATILDARGNLSTQAYDGFDRPCRLSFPMATVGAGQSAAPVVPCRTTATLALDSGTAGDFEEMRYDAAGNRSWVRRRDGRVIHFTYDALGRETLKDLPDTTTADVYTAYDLTNRVLSARFGSAGGFGIMATYDKPGRMLTETLTEATFSRTMTYAYDKVGNRTAVTWPDSFRVDYNYNPANQLAQIQENVGAVVLATFTYDNLGRRTKLTRGTTAPTDYAYDTASRLISLVQNPAATAFDQTWGFGYSPASQVLSRSDTNAAYKWIASSATPPVAYDGINRDGTIAALSDGYDLRGNVTNDGARTFAYDVENRLTSVVGDGPGMTLGYDPQGRLSSTTSAGSTTQFLYDGSRLSAEYDGAGVLLRRYVHGPGVDEPLVWYEKVAGVMQPRWLHQDRQGSVVAWSDGAGTVLADRVYAYGPWGEPRGGAFTGSRFRYTGQIALPEVKLYHYKARVYDPIGGRFLQTDPIGYKDDLNLYAYVGGDPVNRTDPTGLAGCGAHSTAQRVALTEAQCTVWQERQRQGLRDVAATRQGLAAWRADPKSATGRAFATAMNKAFGRGALSQKNIAKLGTLLNNLEGFYRDPGTAKGGLRDVYVLRGATSGGSQTGGQTAMGSSIFEAADTAYKRMAVIHEPSHLFGIGDRGAQFPNGSWGNVASPFWDMWYAADGEGQGNNPQGAQNNADNWACLISGQCK